MSGIPIRRATAALTIGAIATASSGSIPASGSTRRVSGSSPTVSRPDVYAPMRKNPPCPSDTWPANPMSSVRPIATSAYSPMRS